MIVAPPRTTGPVMHTAGVAVGAWQMGPLGPGRYIDTVEVLTDAGWVYARVTSRLELEFGLSEPRTVIITDPAQLVRLCAAIGILVQA